MRPVIGLCHMQEVVTNPRRERVTALTQSVLFCV